MSAPEETGPKWGRGVPKQIRLAVANTQLKHYKKHRLINNCFCFFNVTMLAFYVTGGAVAGILIHAALFVVHFVLVRKYTSYINTTKDLIQQEHDNPHWS